MRGTTGLVDSLERTWGQVLGALPDLGLAVVLLFAGWLAAKVARRIAVRFFRLVRLDQAAESAPASRTS